MSRDFDLIEFDLARLTAQSAQQDPKHIQGGQPEYTRADIIACAAELPHIAWHCLLAKYCGDEMSEREVLHRARTMSLWEWFDNPAYRTTPIQAGQLNKLAELAVLVWIQPGTAHTRSIESRAAYVGAARETFRLKLQEHYAWLVKELLYLEAIGKIAYRQKKYGKRSATA